MLGWRLQSGTSIAQRAPSNGGYSLFCMQEVIAQTNFGISLNPRAVAEYRLMVRIKGEWWSQAGSNRRPPACKAGALPAELWPLE